MPLNEKFAFNCDSRMRHINSVRRMQSYSMLKQVVQKEVLGFKGLTISWSVYRIATEFVTVKTLNGVHDKFGFVSISFLS
jgi:hypothetical protein